ncbi:MAG: exonuclease domain-containing protein [Ignavibacteria bacterium]|nr:exonuclease domain-containing protein [Ignavibacteria bacterium]
MGSTKDKKKTELTDTTFIVCDVETTGLSPHTSRMTEIALIKIRYDEIIDTYTTLINPGQHIPAGITQLTGITNEDVFDKPPFEEIAKDVLNFMKDGESDNVIFTGHNVGFDYSFLAESFKRCGEEYDFNYQTLCTCKLARRILRKLKSKSLGNVAAHFGIKQKRRHRAYDDTLATAKILSEFLEILQDEYEFETIEEVIKFQNTKIYSGENRPAALKRIKIELKDIPTDPGVYFMKSTSGENLYIGKAKSLRERLSSYFRHNDNLSYKIKRLLTNIRALEWVITDSELSALILESKMIKKHKPRFNTAIKRFRHHPFLKLDIQNEFPKVEAVYEIENDGAYYYGPFTSKGTIRQIYKTVYEEFKLRKCEDKKIKASDKNSNCMYFDIGKCSAPCTSTISKSDYLTEVEKVHNHIIGSGKNSAVGVIKTLMLDYAENEEYERAALLRDRLHDIQKVMSYQKVITSAINDKKIIIKCDNEDKREIFFIHNGKLMRTITLHRNDDFDQRDAVEEITDIVESLYFSLNKFAKHKFTQEELDEIKVISNWLALNRDRNSFLEISENHNVEQLIQFTLK